MRINESILDDLEAQSTDISKVIQTDSLGWPGDKCFTVYFTLEFKGSIEAWALKRLTEDTLYFLELLRKVVEYSRICPTDANYRLIRDEALDDAIDKGKKFKNYALDFGISHRFRTAMDVIRFFTKLTHFFGKKLVLIKVRANYNLEHSAPVSIACAEMMKGIFIDKKTFRATMCEDVLNDALKIVNIMIPDNEAVALEVIDAIKPSYDLYVKKIRGKFYPLSLMYSDFNLESKKNYLELPEDFHNRMLDERLSWQQINRFDNVHSAIHDLIGITDGGAEINDNRAEVMKVLDERPVKIHDAVFRFNERRDMIFVCVTTNPFLVDTKHYKPNFELGIFSFWLCREGNDWNTIKIIWPWMTLVEYQMIWKILERQQ